MDNTRILAISIVTTEYHIRYNLHEFSVNNALGICANPSFGFSYCAGYSNVVGIITMPYLGTIHGFGSFSLPLLFEYDFGAGATKETDKRLGGFAGAGAEYILLPILKSSGFPNYSYIQFAASGGFRYNDKHDRLREINLLFGLGSSYAPPNNIEPQMSGYSYQAKLSWILFL